MYLRKSQSDDPSESLEDTLSRHEIDLQDLAIKLFGARIPEENILREIVSGETISDRPEMQKLLKMIESPKVKGVFTIEPQRLSRGDWEDGGKVLSVFRYTNTLIYTPRMTYALTNEMDYKLFKMELSQGHDYLEYTKMIFARGKSASVKAGNFIGNKAAYGYDRVKCDKRYVLMPNNEADVVRYIFDLYVNHNLGYSNICYKLEELGIKPPKGEQWANTSIFDIVSNPVYIGKIRWNARKTEKKYVDGQLVKTRPRNKNFELYDGKHDPIIDLETFNKAQDKLGRNTKEKKFTELKNPLAGIIFCENCGKAMVYREFNSKGIAKCAPRVLCPNQVKCGTKSVRFSVLYDSVVQAITEIYKDFEIKYKNDEDANVDYYQNIINDLEKKLEKLEERQTKLYDLFEDGTYTKDIFLMRNRKLAEERESLKQNLKRAKENIPMTKSYEECVMTFHDVLENLKDDTVPIKVKNNLLKEIIERIDYHNCESKTNRNDDNQISLKIKLKDSYIKTQA